MSGMPEMFGSMVFNDDVMKRRLPHDTYKALKRKLSTGEALDRQIADVVANAMKDWAIEKGVTHFTHWFQPMTGITAEKHDAFIEQQGDGIIMEFSGKNLIKGEPDASSFPSGGLRATFEARGYTAWDPTSYAFIKDKTLCIPTAFCSYTGEALDKKTPLLRSMEALNTQALRVLRLFGRTDVQRVISTVGAEQEYFLIDRSVYEKRPDLILTGRTLFGAKPSKGQELGDHYFGALKTRVNEYMRDLDEELWKLGVFAKTEHNEAAPAQHELAPLFTSANVAVDQNQIIMEMMKKVAARHNMACLLHEKPFASVNGSGKHDNWSLATDKGVNLLAPGDSPIDNAQFLLLLCAVISAVDKHQDLLRISAASAGNDQRLGGFEAPPTILSMFLGDELTQVLEAIENDSVYDRVEKTEMNVGIDVMPRFSKDMTDRNRTSPFAFTGNKFEFRMVGSAFSVAGPNIILNTIIADELMQYADVLENAEDFGAALNRLLRTKIHEHKRIIFNGNSYSKEWKCEAEKRGLLNWSSSAEAIAHLSDEENQKLFERHSVYTGAELLSRQDILLENYAKLIHIEAATMLDMTNRNYLPAVIEYSAGLASDISIKESVRIDASVERKQCVELSQLAGKIVKAGEALTEAMKEVEKEESLCIKARDSYNKLYPKMEELRVLVDHAEKILPAKSWPFPTYEEMLFSIH